MYKWSIGSVELRTGESVARMQTLETRRQSGAVARRDRIKHHRDDVVKRKKGGKKKERWEGR